MKAWVLENVGKFKLKEIEKPSSDAESEIIKVKACGICGSDIPRVYETGAHNMPLVVGHEFAGETAGGRRVGVFPLIPCGECPQCKNKKYEMCENYNYLGSRCDGGFAEYVKVPKWNLIDLPDTVSFEEAAMLEPMAVAVHAMRRYDIETLKDKNVAVYGLGTIGLLLTMFLKDAGAKKIYAFGNKGYQKQKAKEIGIDESFFCNTKETNPKDWLSGDGFDLVFECIGKNETISDCIELATPGAEICLVGNPYTDMAFDKDTYWQILRKQITIKGTWNSSFTKEENDDWHYVLKRISSGEVNPAKLISHKFDLENIYKGFEIMRDKKEDYTKIMMEM